MVKLSESCGRRELVEEGGGVRGLVLVKKVVDIGVEEVQGIW